MKIINVQQRTPEWDAVRRGKVTATDFDRLISTRKSTIEAYFYEVLAGRMIVSDGFDKENAMDRGTRLESEARETFEKKSGLKVEVVGFVVADWNPNAGYSPDGLIKKGKKYPEDIEIKCLKPGNHVQAWITKKIPDDYMGQIIYAFMINDDLKRRHVVFYDPRISVKPYFTLVVEREEVAEEIEKYTKFVKEFLKKVDTELSKRVKL